MKVKLPTLAILHKTALLTILLAIPLLSPSSAGAAEPFKMEMPIRCIVGEDCWLVNYVDVDSTKAVSDYKCAKASYDGHKGVDIAITDATVMRDGVPVYAAAAGVVRGARNDMADINFKRNGGPDSVAGKECGNGVLIDHGGGWTTQYCHMLKGSVLGRPGDKVASGRQIGLVGMSGLSEFPHIHIQVKFKDKIVDPFTGVESSKGCETNGKPLWNDEALAAMPYQPTAIYNAGFATTTPNQLIAREGLYADEVLLDTSPVIALWADVFWVKAGDKVTFLVSGPDGSTLLGHTATLKKSVARRFVYAGMRRKDPAWPKGTYTGVIRLNRAATGEEISTVRLIEIN